MGGVVDCGVGTDTKASPRRAAIDESQTQMPMKADGTVERMKEFEFLVNGGDVLTYKVSQAGSISVQSTSIRDQLAEQYIISEAKSSFALAPSPHGDSVESSGRPGGSSGREPNIADNLLLFDGENSNIGGDRNLKFNRKRGNGGPLEQCSQIDGCDDPKEAVDSVLLGFKRQAYARRNRSRSSRDSTHVGSTDVSPADTNKLTNFPSSHSGSLQGLLCGKLEDHALSSISNSKPNGNIVSKTSVSKDQLDMELDTV